MSTKNTEPMVFNGINGATGDYLLQPLTAHQVSQIAQGIKPNLDHLQDLKHRSDAIRNPALGLIFGLDPKDLGQTGWGIIFAHEADPAVKDALNELLNHRKKQAGDLYKEMEYYPEETKSHFLERYGAGPGPVDPTLVPYYLLIVGDPATIPYSFQYQIDVQYSVGRIYFSTPQEYAQYAHNVTAVETGNTQLQHTAAFFATQNEGDLATDLSANQLTKPLADYITANKPDWTVKTYLRDQATKEQLRKLLGGTDTPTFLFTASHGMGFPSNDARQLDQQGALLCQDWPGPDDWHKPIPQDFYFAMDDVADDARLAGLISLHFACYGAGTPSLDDFTTLSHQTIAPHAFMAHLPQRLLSHSKGGALAFVGHVERAWGYSFMWGGAGPQLQTFQSTCRKLMAGYPIGSAIEYFNDRYAELAADLAEEIDQIKRYGKSADDFELANMWTANNDARNFVIIGDPAVRLPVADGAAGETAHPIIETVTLTQSAGGRHPAKPRPLTRDAKSTSMEETLPSDVMQRPRASVPTTTVGASTAVVDYGLIDFGQARDRLAAALQQVADKIGTALQKAVDDLTSLEVSTFVSDDMEQVQYADGKFTGPVKMRAMTRVNIDGDTLVCVPEQDGGIDQVLWTIHSDTVARSQTHRTELIQMTISAASALLSALKPT